MSQFETGYGQTRVTLGHSCPPCTRRLPRQRRNRLDRSLATTRSPAEPPFGFPPHGQIKLFVVALLDDRRTGDVAGPDSGRPPRLCAFGRALGGADPPALRPLDRRSPSCGRLEAGDLRAGVRKTQKFSAKREVFDLALADRVEPLLL